MSSLSLTVGGLTGDVSVLSWDEASLSVDVMEVGLKGWTGTPAKGGVATVAVESNQLFKGRVVSVGESLTGQSEGAVVRIAGALHDLDNTPYLAKRSYAVKNASNEWAGDRADKNVGVCGFPSSMTTGERISALLDYAISVGSPVVKGTIEAGIPWIGERHKGQTIGQVLRHYAELTPELTVWVDYSKPTPELNYSTGGATHAVMDGDKLSVNQAFDTAIDLNGVVIDYETLQTLDDGTTDVTLVRDSVGAEEGYGVLRYVIPMGGVGGGDDSDEVDGVTGHYSAAETMPVVCDAIPTDAGECEEFFIKKIPALNSLDKDIGGGLLAGAIAVATNNILDKGIIAFKRSVDVPQRAPVNPNANPVNAPNGAGDYPNELVSGTLMPWMKRRWAEVTVEGSILVLESAIDGIQNGDWKARMEDVFSQRVETGGQVYRMTTASIKVTGTNAVTQVYKRYNLNPSSAGALGVDAGGGNAEMVPNGIAQAIWDQHQGEWAEGSIARKLETVARVWNVGDRITTDFGTGIVGSVSYDLAAMEASASFGPQEHLGPQDLIDRMQNMNESVEGEPPTPEEVGKVWEFDTDEEEVATGNPSTVITLTAGREEGDAFIWAADVFKDGGDYKCDFVPGQVVDVPAGSEMDATGADQTQTVAIGDVWGVKVTTSTDGEVTAAAFEKFDEPEKQDYKPALSDSGQDGEYYFPCVEFEDVGGAPSPVYKRTDSITWHGISMSNEGGGAKVLKDFNEASRKLRARSLVAGGSELGGTANVQVKLEISENDNTIEFTASGFIDDSQYGGTTGYTGVTTWRRNGESGSGKDSTITFSDGLATAVVDDPLVVNYQIPLKGRDHIKVDNNNPANNPNQGSIFLANSNSANEKPANGTVGFFPYYVAMAGEVGHTVLYGTDPKVLDDGAGGETTFTQSTDDQHEEGGTVDSEGNDDGGY